MRFTDEERSITRQALAAAIKSAHHRDNLGPLAEHHQSQEREGWSEYDESATDKNVAVARSALAKLLVGYWGIATLDEGIFDSAPTRDEALKKFGFATPYRRERRGKLYEYTSDEGSQVVVGRVNDLLAAGYELLPEPLLR